MPQNLARTRLLVLALATVTAAACERRAAGAGEDEPLLTLTVETPEALSWGTTGVLRISLANEGTAVAPGALVEVYVPSWLEFGTVEPAGTAVTVVSGEPETRLVYSFTDSLPPGDRRAIRQHLRVLHQPPPTMQPGDTVETVSIAPLNQTVRARLLDVDGQPQGVEVHATLTFVAAAPAPLPPAAAPADTLPRPDTAAAPADTLERRDTIPR